MSRQGEEKNIICATYKKTRDCFNVFLLKNDPIFGIRIKL